MERAGKLRPGRMEAASCDDLRSGCSSSGCDLGDHLGQSQLVFRLFGEQHTMFVLRANNLDVRKVGGSGASWG